MLINTLAKAHIEEVMRPLMINSFANNTNLRHVKSLSRRVPFGQSVKNPVMVTRVGLVCPGLLKTLLMSFVPKELVSTR